MSSILERMKSQTSKRTQKTKKEKSVAEESQQLKITVAAISIKHNSIMTADEKWYELSKENANIFNIQKGKEYLCSLDPETNTLSNFEDVTEPTSTAKTTASSVKDSAVFKPKVQEATKTLDGSTAKSKIFAPKQEDPSPDVWAMKDWRITKLAAIDRAIQFLSATKGETFALEDVLEISDKFVEYAYTGKPSFND